MHRVVITGLGIISALGHDRHKFWQALCESKSGIADISQVDCQSLRFQQGAEVKNFSSDDYFEPKRINYLDRFTQFALISAKEAIMDAGLSKSDFAHEQTAIITGSCLGGKITEDNVFYRLYHEGNPRTNPATIPNAMANAGASQIAFEFGITGPTYTISTACSSSTHAIGNAFWLVRNGVVQRAIAGGSEAPFSFGQLKAWEAMRIVASDTCRPFSRGRQGLILGEGGGMLVLESLVSARARGARIYAEIIGFGMSADAKHIIEPHSVGQQRAILAALNDAGIPHDAINYINAHGTGTIVNDRVEAETIRTIFGNKRENLSVSSTKAAHGHLLGATGAIETIATVLALKYGTIPPTLHYLAKDDDCDMPSLITHHAKTCDIEFAMCFSFAFGGLNSILAFRAF